MRDDLEKQLNVAELFPLVLTLAPLLLCTSLDSSNIPFFLPFFSLFFSLFLLPLFFSPFPSLSLPPPFLPPSLHLSHSLPTSWLMDLIRTGWALLASCKILSVTWRTFSATLAPIPLLYCSS